MPKSHMWSIPSGFLIKILYISHLSHLSVYSNSGDYMSVVTVVMIGNNLPGLRIQQNLFCNYQDMHNIYDLQSL